MRKNVVALLTLLLILLLWVSCTQDQIAPPSMESTSAIIKGVLDLSKAKNVSGSDIWIKVVCDGDTRNISRANADGSFSVSGLRENEKYDILFSTIKPETSNERDISRDANQTSGFGGWLSNVTAAINEGNNVGSVSIKPLGTIKGNVTLDGMEEHYDILVYIPGTSFSAFTDGNGDFSLYNVPESTYKLRASYLKSGFGSAMSEDVTVRGSKTNDEEHPVVLMDNIVLYRDLGTIEGKVLLDSDNDATGITVMIKTLDGARTYTSSTDTEGSYHINDVKPGTYVLYASKAGFDTVIVENVVVVPASTKVVPVQTLSSGVRYVNGKVHLEGRTDYSGALVTATNTKETSLVYSAISNDVGDFSLVNMKPGEYRVTVTMNNYNTHTVGVVGVLKNSSLDLDVVNLTITRGTINGAVDLEGRSSNAGVKAELMKGTDVYETVYSDDSGSYSFNVPQGNYSGVRLSCENFKSVAIAQSIALIANDCVAIDNGSTTQMVATHVPVIRGRVTVSGLLDQDYSGIIVTLEGTDFATETDHDGYWTFCRIPVGDYTLRFERLNTRDVTKQIAVRAMAEMTIEDLALEPNAASIEGHVTLNSISDYSNITVRATADGASELRTTTNAAGYFYIGNVITTKTYTVTFEKDGWVSQNREISGLENLSLNDITESHPIELVDTTAPIITSLVVNTGSSELEGRKLSVHMNIAESGSGVDKVYVNTTDDFTGVEGQDYASPFTCHVPDVAGDYTLYVKVQDRSGNMSAVSSSAFRVAEYRTVVSGVLVDNEDGVRDNIITWTKQGSPYYVTSSVLIDENTTLNIEAGVNVQFSGAYYMQVEGRLNINGTESENVYLYGVGFGEDNWTGIKGVKDTGSTICHANITGMAQGLQGYLRVVDSTIASTGTLYALGGDSSYFYGTVENSDITGRLYCSGSSLLHNDVSSAYYEPDYKYDAASLLECYLNGNQFTGVGVSLFKSTGENNIFSNMEVFSSYTGMLNATFENCALKLTNGGAYIRCEFDGSTFSEFSPAMVKDSNLIDCGVIAITTVKTTYERLDMTGNYWGVNNTSEINTKSVNSNLSFIEDYYDDFNRTKVDVSGYVAAPLSNVGYLGDSYYSETIESAIEYSIGDVGPAGGWVFYDKGYYSDGWRYLECAPSYIGSYVFGCYRATNDSDRLSTGTSTAVGSGRLNTAMLVETMGDNAYIDYDKNGETTSEYAANKCMDYILGGYDDWFLPSKDELYLMYRNLQLAEIIFFDGSTSWSSSEVNDYGDAAWIQSFGDGARLVSGRIYTSCVHAVRAF